MIYKHYMKTCTLCKLTVPLNLFPLKGKETGRSPRLDSLCFSCKKLKLKEYYKIRVEKERTLKPLKPEKHISEPGHKRCTKCLVDKPQDNNHFSNSSKNKDGFNYVCKVCFKLKRTSTRSSLISITEPLSGTKNCNTCEVEYFWTEFRVIKNKAGNRALYYQCKPCERNLYVQKRAKDPEKYKEISKKHRSLHKDKINERSRVKYHENIDESVRPHSPQVGSAS